MENAVGQDVSRDVSSKDARDAAGEASRKAAQRRNNWRLGVILFAVAAAFFASAIIQQLRAH